MWSFRRIADSAALCEPGDIRRLGVAVSFAAGLVAGCLAGRLLYDSSEAFQRCMDLTVCRATVVGIAVAVLVLGSVLIGGLILPTIFARATGRYLQAHFRDRYEDFKSRWPRDA